MHRQKTSTPLHIESFLLQGRAVTVICFLIGRFKSVSIEQAVTYFLTGTTAKSLEQRNWSTGMTILPAIDVSVPCGDCSFYLPWWGSDSFI